MLGQQALDAADQESLKFIIHPLDGFAGAQFTATGENGINVDVE